MGGERGGGVERRLEQGRSQGLNLFLSVSLPPSPIRFGSGGLPIQALFSKGTAKRKQTATAFLGDASRRRVAAGGFAFDIHCCQQCF